MIRRQICTTTAGGTVPLARSSSRRKIADSRAGRTGEPEAFPSCALICRISRLALNRCSSRLRILRSISSISRRASSSVSSGERG
jgi:hypothetical protein